MNKFVKAMMLLLLVFPLAGFSILGCGGGDPKPETGDFEASDIEAIEEAVDTDRQEEERAKAPGAKAPKGEPTAPDDGP